jgi:hypothetical protein
LVFSLTLDSALNLLWLGICVAAVIWFGRFRWRRSFTVFLATVALFPIVSDSDDLFSFSLLRVPGHHHRSAGTIPEDSRERDTAQLAHLIESLDHWQVAPFFEIAVALCFFVLLFSAQWTVRSRSVLASGGRSPPLA